MFFVTKSERNRKGRMNFFMGVFAEAANVQI
jgi:hypothetical protein